MMASKEGVENEDTSYDTTQPSLNLVNLPSDVMNAVNNSDAEQMFQQLFGQSGMGTEGSLDTGSGPSSLTSQGSQRSHDTQFSAPLSAYPVPTDPQFRAPEDLQIQEVPSMEVTVINSIVRFRYASELSNRRTGKEELLKIKFTGVRGYVPVLIHAVDSSSKRAHPYLLIGDKCQDGMFISNENITEAKCECTCKATLKIPKRQEYQQSLEERRARAEQNNIFNDRMKEDSYWTANKNMKECHDICLYVEARYSIGNNNYTLSCVTRPLSNAKEGKCFMIHRIMPYTAPAMGILDTKDYIVIVLTADSYIPKAVEVQFEDDEGWLQRSPKVNIIKNCIECAVPPYKDQGLQEPKEVLVKILDKQKDMTAAYNFMYMVNPETHTAKKRKRAMEFCAPGDVLQASGLDTISFTKRPILTPSRARRGHSGGFLTNVSTTSTLTAATESEQTISHFGVNAPNQLPHLIVKQEPQDTYESACGYQGNNTQFPAGVAVTKLLTKGHDPNLQSISLGDVEPANFTSVSLLLPSGSDGMDKEVAMETSGGSRMGSSGQSMAEQLAIHKILLELKSNLPGQQSSQHHGYVDSQISDQSLVAILQNMQQSAQQQAQGTDDSQLTFPVDSTQNPPMYPISSNVNRNQASIINPIIRPDFNQTAQRMTFNPASQRATLNPASQRSTRDIQNMLDAQHQYPNFPSIDATQAVDLETDSDNHEICGTANSHIPCGDHKPCDSGDNRVPRDIGDDHKSCDISGSQNVDLSNTEVDVCPDINKDEEDKDSCDACTQNQSRSDGEKTTRAAILLDSSDLETDSVVSKDLMGKDIGDLPQEGLASVRSQGSGDGDGVGVGPPVSCDRPGNNTIPQDEVTESLEKLSLT